MKNELLERIATSLEGIHAELAQTRLINQKLINIEEEKTERKVRSEPTFDGFLQYHNLLHPNALNGLPFELAWKMYTDATQLSTYLPITKNKFARLVHAMGYATKAKKKDGKIISVFVKQNIL